MATQQIKGSKRYRQSAEMVDLEKTYPVAEASALLNKLPKAKFDETVELYANLTVDPRKSDQMVRGTLQLPHGSGKTVRVIVFTENPEEAIAAGADEAGFDDLIEKVIGGWIDFDVAISTTSAMKSVRKVARVLGPRGLMPNPKAGTVTMDVAKAVTEVKAGKIDFKVDKYGIIHASAGKVSFSAEQLTENANELMNVIMKLKPSSSKGAYVRSLTFSSTQSVGVKVEVKSFL